MRRQLRILYQCSKLILNEGESVSRLFFYNRQEGEWEININHRVVVGEDMIPTDGMKTMAGF